MTNYSKKTGDHLLRSVSCANKFCLIWLVLKDPYSGLLFSFGFKCIYPWLVTCHNLIDNIYNTAIEFFQHFFAPMTQTFFERLQIMRYTMRTNLFDSQRFMQYWMYPNGTNALVCVKLMWHEDLAISVQHRYFLAQQPILDDLHEIYPVAKCDHDWIRKTSETRWLKMVLYRKKVLTNIFFWSLLNIVLCLQYKTTHCLKIVGFL